MVTRKEHWQKIYQTRASTEVSWYQSIPATSLEFFKELGIPKDAAIIDIGAGDGNLVDHLLNLGYTNITVLDISAVALEKTRQRLGKKAEVVRWIVGDVLQFKGDMHYDVWHDRAVLHFLTADAEIEKYFAITERHLKEGGHMITGTFSINGPSTCSGLPVKRYTPQTLTAKARNYLEKIKCITTQHLTPLNTIQEFIFCSFIKLKSLHGHS